MMRKIPTVLNQQEGKKRLEQHTAAQRVTLLESLIAVDASVGRSLPPHPSHRAASERLAGSPVSCLPPRLPP